MSRETKWMRVNDYIKDQLPSFTLFEPSDVVTQERFTDLNARSFPKRGTWHEEGGREWFYAGFPGIWDLKVPGNHDVPFPDIRHRVSMWRTFGKKDVQLVCEIESIYRQNVKINNRHTSVSTARCVLIPIQVWMEDTLD
jgi:hypothetical protein